MSSRLDFFREILNLNEKSRGLDRDVRMIIDFSESVKDSKLFKKIYQKL